CRVGRFEHEHEAAAGRARRAGGERAQRLGERGGRICGCGHVVLLASWSSLAFGSLRETCTQNRSSDSSSIGASTRSTAPRSSGSPPSRASLVLKSVGFEAAAIAVSTEILFARSRSSRC